MKPDIHPHYRPVVFLDQSADISFITRSTIQTPDTIEWEDGNTYPLAKVEISSASHPFFTGTMKIVDTAGRVERFERRYGRKRKADGSGTEPAESAVEEAPVEEAPVAETPDEKPAVGTKPDRKAFTGQGPAAEESAEEAEAPAPDMGSNEATE